MLAENVAETCLSQGLVDYQLDGPYGTGYRTFVTGFGDGKPAFYVAQNAAGTEKEFGYGDVTDAAPDTLTRNVLWSTAGGGKINWTEPPAVIFNAISAEWAGLEMTHYAGTARPAWLPPFKSWVKTDATPVELHWWDGAADLVIGTLSDSGDGFGFFNRVAISTDSSAAAGPFDDLVRDSADPAPADIAGERRWFARNSTGLLKALSRIRQRLDVVTNAAESAVLELWSYIAGTDTKIMEWGARVLLFRAIDQAKASSIAVASSTDIWSATGNLIHLTAGAGTLTNFGTASLPTGAERFLISDTAFTLSHNANCDLETGADIAIVAGDRIWVRADTTTKAVVCVMRASGVPLVTPAVASKADMETATDTAKIVPPARVMDSPYAAKAWVKFTAITTTAINASAGVTSLTDNGTGDTTINLSTAFSSANYAAVGLGEAAGSGTHRVFYVNGSSRTASACRVIMGNVGGVLADFDGNLAFFGDQ